MATSSPQYRCEIPYFPDPGQPSTPTATQNLYLVTGGDFATAGAYATWNTAGHNSQGVSSRTVKRYGPAERGAMRGAWHAGCNRGEHPHPADPALLSPIQRTPPTVARSPPSLGSTGLLWTPTPAPAPKTPQPGPRKVPIFSEDTPRAATAFELRPGGEVIRGAFRHRRLGSSGRRVEMAIANGFTQAVAFAEGGAPADDTPEGRRRKEWAAQERRAFRERRAAEEQRALEEERARAAYREHIVDELQYYREDDSGSEHSSDGSDGDRSTDDLEQELNLRVSHGSNLLATVVYIFRTPNKMSTKSTKKQRRLREGVRRDVLGNHYAEMLEWAMHKKALAAKKPGPATECYWHELGCDLCKKNKSTARTF
ncbi:hypothetical protein B0H11DRAFT_2266897 [Mycena galericulata]|nr:hypothetical protein B0H11DRAFT_2266897 [Mycena galericulata]